MDLQQVIQRRPDRVRPELSQPAHAYSAVAEDDALELHVLRRVRRALGVILLWRVRPVDAEPAHRPVSMRQAPLACYLPDHVSPPSSTSSAARSRSRTSISAATSHPPPMGGYWQNGHMVGNPPGGRQPTHPVSTGSGSGTTRTGARRRRMCWSLKYSRAGPCRFDSRSAASMCLPPVSAAVRFLVMGYLLGPSACRAGRSPDRGMEVPGTAARRDAAVDAADGVGQVLAAGDSDRLAVRAVVLVVPAVLLQVADVDLDLDLDGGGGALAGQRGVGIAHGCLPGSMRMPVTGGGRRFPRRFRRSPARWLLALRHPAPNAPPAGGSGFTSGTRAVLRLVTGGEQHDQPGP